MQPPRNDVTADMAIVKSEVLHLRKDVNRILDILLENPEYSISPRVKVIENENKEFRKTFDKIEEQAWQLKLALLTSLVGFAGSLAVVCFEIFLKIK